MKKRSIARKITALFTALFFVWESAVGFTFPAIEAFPTAAGAIKAEAASSTPKNVILVLNAHASSEAQKNIAELLAFFQSEGVDLVGLEGAAGKIDGEIFRRFPFKDSLKAAAWEMVKEGIFTGAEYFYITAEKLPDFYGLEDKNAYFENRDAFVETVEGRQKLEPVLKELRDAREALKQRVYSRRLKRFDEAVSANAGNGFKPFPAHFPDYLHVVIDTAKRTKIGLTRFENLYRLSKALEREKKFSRSGLMKDLDEIEQLASVGNGLKPFPTLKDVFNLIRASGGNKTFDETALDYKKIDSFLSDLIESGALDLNRYKHLAQYAEWLRAFSNLEPAKLFDELEEAVEGIYAKLAVSEKEKEVVALAKQFETFEKMLAIELAQKEWARIKNRKQEAGNKKQEAGSKKHESEISRQKSVGRRQEIRIESLPGSTGQSRLDFPRRFASQSEAGGGNDTALMSLSDFPPQRWRIRRSSVAEIGQSRNFDLKSALAFLSSELKDRAPQLTSAEIESLKKTEASARRFYEGAESRNEIFAARIESALAKSGKDTSVVVAGGFHEEGLKAALNRRGISTLVVSPKINGPVSDIPYLDRMLGKPAHIQEMVRKLTNAIDFSSILAPEMVRAEVRAQVALGEAILAAALELFKAKEAGGTDFADTIKAVNESQMLEGVEITRAFMESGGGKIGIGFKTKAGDQFNLIIKEVEGKLNLVGVPVISVPAEPRSETRRPKPSLFQWLGPLPIQEGQAEIPIRFEIREWIREIRQRLEKQFNQMLTEPAETGRTSVAEFQSLLNELNSHWVSFMGKRDLENWQLSFLREKKRSSESREFFEELKLLLGDLSLLVSSSVEWLPVLYGPAGAFVNWKKLAERIAQTTRFFRAPSIKEAAEILGGEMIKVQEEKRTLGQDDTVIAIIEGEPGTGKTALVEYLQKNGVPELIPATEVSALELDDPTVGGFKNGLDFARTQKKPFIVLAGFDVSDAFLRYGQADLKVLLRADKSTRRANLEKRGESKEGIARLLDMKPGLLEAGLRQNFAFDFIIDTSRPVSEQDQIDTPPESGNISRSETRETVSLPPQDRLSELKGSWDRVLTRYFEDANRVLSQAAVGAPPKTWRKFIPDIIEHLKKRLPENRAKGVPTIVVVAGSGGAGKSEITAGAIEQYLSRDKSLNEAGAGRIQTVFGDDLRLETAPFDYVIGRQTVQDILLELQPEYLGRQKASDEAKTKNGIMLDKGVREARLRKTLTDFENLNQALIREGFKPYDLTTGEPSTDPLAQFDNAKLISFWEKAKGISEPGKEQVFDQYLPVYDQAARGRVRLRLSEERKIQIIFRVRDNLLLEIHDPGEGPLAVVFKEHGKKLTGSALAELSEKTDFYENGRLKGIEVEKITRKGGKEGIRIRVRGSAHDVFLSRNRKNLTLFYEGITEPTRIKHGQMADVLVCYDLDPETLLVFEWMLASGLDPALIDAFVFLDADAWVRLLRQEEERFLSRGTGINRSGYVAHRLEAGYQEDRLIRESLEDIERSREAKPENAPPLFYGNTERRHERLLALARRGNLTGPKIAAVIKDAFGFKPADFQEFKGNESEFSPAHLIQAELDRIVERVVREELERSGYALNAYVETPEGIVAVSSENYVLKFRKEPGKEGAFELNEKDLSLLRDIKGKAGGYIDPFTIMDFEGLAVTVVKADGTQEQKRIGKVLVQSRSIWKSLKARLDYLAERHREASDLAKRGAVERIRKEAYGLLRNSVQNDFDLAALGILNTKPGRNLAQKEIRWEDGVGNSAQTAFNVLSLRKGDVTAELNAAAYREAFTAKEEEDRYRIPDAFEDIYERILNEFFPPDVLYHLTWRNLKGLLSGRKKHFRSKAEGKPVPAPVSNIISWEIAKAERLYLGSLVLKAKIRAMRLLIHSEISPGESAGGWDKALEWAYLYKKGIVYPPTLAYKAMDYIYSELEKGPEHIGSLDRLREAVLNRFPRLKSENPFDHMLIEAFFNSAPRHFFARAVILDYDGILYRSTDQPVLETFRKVFQGTLPPEEFYELFAEIYRNHDEELRSIRRAGLTGNGTFEAYLNYLNKKLREKVREKTGIMMEGAVSEEAFRNSLSADERLLPGAVQFVRELVEAGIPVVISSDQYAGIEAEERVRRNLDRDFPGLFPDEAVFFSFHVGARKQDGEAAFKPVLDYLGSLVPGLKREEALFIDDHEWNAGAARKIGIQAAVYNVQTREGTLSDHIAVSPFKTGESRSEARQEEKELGAGSAAQGTVLKPSTQHPVPSTRKLRSEVRVRSWSKEEAAAEGKELAGRFKLQGPLKRVLVVEDDQFARETLVWVIRSIEKGRLLVDEAENGAAALELIASWTEEEKKAAFVITDIGMPVLNGIELAKALRAKDSNFPPILVVSGRGPFPELNELLNLEQLIKPVHIETYRELFEGLLARYPQPSEGKQDDGRRSEARNEMQRKEEREKGKGSSFHLSSSRSEMRARAFDAVRDGAQIHPRSLKEFVAAVYRTLDEMRKGKVEAYSVTNIKQMNDGSPVLYFRADSELVEQTGGNIHPLLAIEDRNERQHDFPGFMNTMLRLYFEWFKKELNVSEFDQFLEKVKLLSDDEWNEFLKRFLERTVVVITDGGLKTRAGNETLGRLHSGLWTFLGGMDARTLNLAVDLTILKMLPKEIRNEVVPWSASDNYTWLGASNLAEIAANPKILNDFAILTSGARVEILKGEEELDALDKAVRELGGTGDLPQAWDSILKDDEKKSRLLDRFNNEPLSGVRQRITDENLRELGVLTAYPKGHPRAYEMSNFFEKSDDDLVIIRIAHLNEDRGALYKNPFGELIHKETAVRMVKEFSRRTSKTLQKQNANYAGLDALVVSYMASAYMPRFYNMDAWEKMKPKEIHRDDWLEMKKVFDQILNPEAGGRSKIYVFDLGTGYIWQDAGHLKPAHQLFEFIAFTEEGRMSMKLPRRRNRLLIKTNLKEGDNLIVRDKSARYLIENVHVVGGGKVEIPRGSDRVIMSNVSIYVSQGKTFRIPLRTQILDASFWYHQVVFSPSAMKRGYVRISNFFTAATSPTIVIRSDENVNTLRVSTGRGFDIEFSRTPIFLPFKFKGGIKAMIRDYLMDHSKWKDFAAHYPVMHKRIPGNASERWARLDSAGKNELEKIVFQALVDEHPSILLNPAIIDWKNVHTYEQGLIDIPNPSLNNRTFKDTQPLIDYRRTDERRRRNLQELAAAREGNLSPLLKRFGLLPNMTKPGLLNFETDMPAHESRSEAREEAREPGAGKRTATQHSAPITNHQSLITLELPNGIKIEKGSVTPEVVRETKAAFLSRVIQPTENPFEGILRRPEEMLVRLREDEAQALIDSPDSDAQAAFLGAVFDLAQMGTKVQLILPDSGEVRSELRQMLDSYRRIQGIKLSAQAFPSAPDFGSNGTLIERSIKKSLANVYLVTDKNEAKRLANQVKDRAILIAHEYSSAIEKSLREKALLMVEAALAALLDWEVFRALEGYENIRVPEASLFANLEQSLLMAREALTRLAAAA